MASFARIIDDVAVDVSADPSNEFHPDIAAQFVPVPEYIRTGWQLDEAGQWSAPAPIDAQPAAAAPPKVSPVEFKLLFTPQERVAMKAARATDPVIDDLFEVLDDPRLTFVDLGLQSTQDAIAYLVLKGLLTQERAGEVLLGTVR